MSYNLLTKGKFITTKSQSEIQNNSVSSQVFELVKSRILNSLDKIQNKDNIKDYFLVLYTSRKVTIVANADIDIENKESVLRNIECDHMNLKLQLDILYNTAKPTIKLNFDDAKILNSLLTSGMIELKQLSGGLYLLTNLTESVVKISNVTTQIENFNNFFTVEMWKRLQNSPSQSNALTLQEAETTVQKSLNSTPYINGLIFEDNILRRYAGKDFIPIPADTQILVKLIKFLSNDKTCAVLPIMIENCDFNKKNTDRLISDLLCSHEYINIYPDLEETYNEVLEGKVLKKNYVKKAKKRLFKHLFYFVMNLESLCGTEKDSDGEILLHYYNEFIQQLLNMPVQKTSISEVVNEDYNFAIHDKETDNISSNVVSPDSHKEFTLLENWNKENSNFIVESTGEQSETDSKTFASYKLESAIDDVAIGKLKKEFLALKADVSNKLSSTEESNKTMYETHDILVENYKSLYKHIESLDKRLNKLENRLPDYKALEKQNTILEYRLDCLVEKLASGNDHYSSVSRNNEYSIKRQQPMYSPSDDDEPPRKVYKSTHDLFQ